MKKKLIHVVMVLGLLQGTFGHAGSALADSIDNSSSEKTTETSNVADESVVEETPEEVTEALIEEPIEPDSSTAEASAPEVSVEKETTKEDTVQSSENTKAVQENSSDKTDEVIVKDAQLDAVPNEGKSDTEVAEEVLDSASTEDDSTMVFTPYGTGLSVSAASPTDLVNQILGSGVTISNVSYTGSGDSSGIFTGDAGIIGFEDGIVLSSGKASDIVGPNSSGGKSTSFGNPGDADLDSLIPGTTRDATVLEFDFVPDNDTLVFQYVFASEEYLEYVNSNYNDVFGFFLDGVNIATISTGEVVSINTINHIKNSDLFRDNTSATIDTEMDGLTTVLTISVSVTPGSTHHIKLAIADAGDSSLDSNVFIKGSSFSTSYQLLYDANGGQGVLPNPVAYKPNETAVVAQSDLTYSGHKFVGWLSSVDGMVYQPEDLLTMSQDVMLSAQWQAVYQVVYDGNEGKGTVPQTQEYEPGTTVYVAAPAGLVREGFEFVGWLSSIDGLIYQAGDSLLVDQDIMLLAQWLANAPVTVEDPKPVAVEKTVPAKPSKPQKTEPMKQVSSTVAKAELPATGEEENRMFLIVGMVMLSLAGGFVIWMKRLKGRDSA